MAIDVICECGREFGVTNDSVGRSVKCPECGSWVRVAEASIAVEPKQSTCVVQRPNVGSETRITSTTQDHASASSREDADSKQASSESRKSKSALKKERAAHRRAESAFHNSSVPLGIAWMYYGLLIGVIAMIGLCSMVLLSQGRQPGLGSAVMILSGLAIVFAAGLMIVGKLLCLSAPSQIPGSGAVLVSLVFDGPTIVMAIAQRGQGLGLSTLSNLLAVGSLVSFLVFLKGLGEFLERRDIADRAASVLWLGFVMIALWVTQLGFTSLVQARGAPPGVGGMGLQMLGVVLGGVWIFVMVRFAGLLSMCRTALDRR
jgi:hypothetical protein